MTSRGCPSPARSCRVASPQVLDGSLGQALERGGKTCFLFLLCWTQAICSPSGRPRVSPPDSRPCGLQSSCRRTVWSHQDATQ